MDIPLLAPLVHCLQIKINWNLWCWFCEGRKTQPTCDAKSVN